MRRYRVIQLDFDTRALSLEPAQEHWKEQVKILHEQNRQKTIEAIKNQFGEGELEYKIKNFIALGVKPFSVMAFHNRFLQQIRNAFVTGAYYPALTGACSLGERILNHLILTLREDYKGTPEYKKVYNKKSFDNWPLAIDTLQSWSVLLPNPIIKFRELNVKRNEAIHFNPETDHNDRDIALEAITTLQEIVNEQFSSAGSQPWFFWAPGEVYIKRDWENVPFIRHVYIPNCALVGYKHRIVSVIPRWVINDRFQYKEETLTDEEFARLRGKRVSP